MKDLPDPSDMLEELADKAISQMDRLAVTSFRTALNEMVDFHRFLIDAHATTNEHGKPDSFARLGDWGSLHADWIREYRRLFERAVDHIGRENDFVEILMYTPLKLLPADARYETPEATATLLDLVNIFVHRLEAWVTRQRSRSSADGSDEGAVGSLAGSDASAYENVVIGFVGAWESTLQHVDHMYKWQKRDLAPDEQWQRFIASWPFLQQHLRNTAYLLAVAVWNEDEIGADYFCGALLRWFRNFEHDLEGEHNLIRSLLSPDVLEHDWPTAKASLAVLLREPVFDEPRPTNTFSAILECVLADTVLVVAGVILGWFMENRQTSDIAPRIVLRLLSDRSDDESSSRAARKVGFRETFLNLVRIYLEGERFAQRGYGAALDGLVNILDSMTERRVIPGRVYTPSTRHERDDLRLPWLCCLAALLPESGEEEAVRTLKVLTEKEDTFPHRDSSLRNLIYDLTQMKAGVASDNRKYLARGVRALHNEANVEERLDRLAATLDHAIIAIEEQRSARLHTRPVDGDKLNAMRLRVERALTEGKGGIDIFGEFRIVRNGSDLPQHRFTVPQVEKGFFTDPVMAQERGNWKEAVTQAVQNYAVRLVWRGFAERSRRVVQAPDEATFLHVLEEEAGPIIQADRQPILLVRSWNDPPWMAEWFSWRRERPGDLQVLRKEGIETGLYVGTVIGVDVYRVDFGEGESLLFPADMLREVKYGADSECRVVAVSFDEDADQQSGNLVFRFSLRTEWTTDDVIVLQYPTASIGEADN